MTEETTAPLDIKFQQRFSKNLISNIIYFILNIIVGLALVPFFLDSLGDVAYALVPLATSVTSYVTLIVQCLNMSVSRYLTLDLQRGDLEKANVTFNTAMFGTLAVVLILLQQMMKKRLICLLMISNRMKNRKNQRKIYL